MDDDVLGVSGCPVPHEAGVVDVMRKNVCQGCMAIKRVSSFFSLPFLAFFFLSVWRFGSGSLGVCAFV